MLLITVVPTVVKVVTLPAGIDAVTIYTHELAGLATIIIAVVVVIRVSRGCKYKLNILSEYLSNLRDI